MVVLRAAVLLAYTTKSRGPWRITPRAVGHACGIEELARTLKGVDTDSDDPRFRRTVALWPAKDAAGDGTRTTAYVDDPTRRGVTMVRRAYTCALVLPCPSENRELSAFMHGCIRVTRGRSAKQPASKCMKQVKSGLTGAPVLTTWQICSPKYCPNSFTSPCIH